MVDDENTDLFGLDNSSLSFIKEGSVPGDANSNLSADPSSISNEDHTFDSNWDFAGPSQFDVFDPVNAATGDHSIYDASLWDASSFNLQPSANIVGGHLAPPPDNNAAFVFGGMPAQSQPGFTKGSSRPKLQTPRQAVTLSPAQEEKLRNIAMPPHLQYHSPNSASSPDSPGGNKKSSQSSPDSGLGLKSDSRKRKILPDQDDDDDDDDEDKPIKKTSHNMIEKRYRNNLNDKIAALRDSVPSLRIMTKSAKGEDTTADREELHGLTPAHKLNKATVLSKATEYIRHLEKRSSRLQNDNRTMRARLEAFEKLFLAGAMNGSIAPMHQPPTPMHYTPQEGQQQQFMSSPDSQNSQNGPSAPIGLIPVPEDMKRIIAAQAAMGRPYPIHEAAYQSSQPIIMHQQQIQQQSQQQHHGRWSNAGPYFGKLMVGSLAGLMILEAVREEEISNERTEGRGLFALPLHLLGGISTCLDFHINGFHVHTSLKLILLIGTVMWICIPSLFAAAEQQPKKTHFVALQPAPSLASSIHVRRQAWLTAIQTVWVPQHNFFLEAAALLLKTAKLSLRNAIGPVNYQLVSGLTVEQEAARIKAWSIALDSQLAGGDVEINNSRMVLTLLASGTLPDTPVRMMLKSLHIRVVLWNISQRWHFGPLHSLAASLARSRWNEARQLNRLLVEARGNCMTPQDDELPEYLAKLVEHECDDILNHGVIQRAYNLAFNLKTTHEIRRPIEGMDAVVEDTAIGSPMDAVAAWWSTQKLHQALKVTLTQTEDGLSSRADHLRLAFEAAPVGSIAQARAIVARAVFSDHRRGENIAKALEVIKLDKLPGSSNQSSSIIDAESYASSPDLKLSLYCAIAVAHVNRIDSTVNTPLQGLRLVEAMMMPRSGAMSLLGCSAAVELMEQLYKHKAAAEAFSPSLERLAGSLRLWIGGTAGERCGLDPDVRHKTVDRCLSITKSLVGMELDTGYGSMSEDEGSTA